MSEQHIAKRTLQELVEHEGVIQEAYLDSVQTWTWSAGITSASGHSVYPRYKDNPQTLEYCIEVYEWAVRENYAPDVLREFEGHPLAEHEFAGALSFHYNTGSIRSASWPDLWKAGDIAGARASFMEWRKPAEVIPRREKEAALFFDGVWSQDGLATVYQVLKPSYTPDWSSARQVDISGILEDMTATDDALPAPAPVVDTAQINALARQIDAANAQILMLTT